jgi:hypothetical protein
VVVGLGLLAIAMTGAVLFVTDVLYGTTTTIAAAAGVGLAFAVLWYAIPLRRMVSGASAATGR